MLSCVFIAKILTSFQQTFLPETKKTLKLILKLSFSNIKLTHCGGLLHIVNHWCGVTFRHPGLPCVSSSRKPELVLTYNAL